MLQALVELDLLRREPGDRYAIGHGVSRLGFEHLASQPLTDVASPVLARLRDSSNCTTHLAVLENRNSIYILRHLTPSPFTPTIGVAAIRRLYRGVTMQKFTERTAQSVEQLLDLLALDRERGYAVSEGFFGNVAAVAAPVRNAAGAIVAGVSVVTAQSSRQGVDMPTAIKDATVAAALEISRASGMGVQRG